MSFTELDRADLELAATIVNAVMDRHPSHDLRVMSALCSAIQDIHLAERYDGAPARTGS